MTPSRPPRTGHARPRVRPPARRRVALAVLLAACATPPMHAQDTGSRPQDAPAAPPSHAVFWAGTSRPVRVDRLTPQGPVPAGSDEPIAWHRVRTIEGPLAGGFERYRDRARAVWRAGARLERGDAAAAEPLFASAFEFYRGETGPTSAMVAEGLLRCRLARDASVPALEAWASLLVACGNNPARAARRRYALPPVIDARTGLCPGLPPIFRPSPSLQRLSDLRTPGLSGETGRIVAWYRAAARDELGRPTGLTELLLDADPTPGEGLRLVRAIVLARIAGPDRRREAREELAVLLERGEADALAWTVPWIRTAAARSLARDTRPADRRLAVARLLHTPVNHADRAPALAALCLADAADVLDELGNRAGADAVRGRLAQLFPAHPDAAVAAAPRSSSSRPPDRPESRPDSRPPP